MPSSLDQQLKYYESLINIRRMHGVLLTPGMSWNGLRGAGLLYPLFWDILYLIPQPCPFLDMDITLWDHGLGRESMYNADTILCCIMFSRCRFVPRFYGEVFSDLSSETAVAIGRLNQLSIDASFIMKFVIANSLQVVSVLFGLQVFMFSYLMMCAERPTEGGALHDFANCMWLVVITMTTVGYGDEVGLAGVYVGFLTSLGFRVQGSGVPLQVWGLAGVCVGFLTRVYTPTYTRLARVYAGFRTWP